MNDNNRGEKDSAFTLTELLVVLGIIAILMALLFPVFAKMRTRAFDALCVNNLHQMGVALLAFRAENNGQIVPYQLSSSQSYHPEAIIDFYLGITNPEVAVAKSPVWNCKLNPAMFQTLPNRWDGSSTSYALNGYFVDDAAQRGVSAALIRHPSTTLLMLERNTSVPDGLGTYVKCDSFFGPGGFFQHSGGNTVLLVDGHVESWPKTHPAFGTNGTYSQREYYWCFDPSNQP